MNSFGFKYKVKILVNVAKELQLCSGSAELLFLRLWSARELLLNELCRLKFWWSFCLDLAGVDLAFLNSSVEFWPPLYLTYIVKITINRVSDLKTKYLLLAKEGK